MSQIWNIRQSRTMKNISGLLIALSAFIVGGDIVCKVSQQGIETVAELWQLAKGIGFILVGALVLIGAAVHVMPSRKRQVETGAKTASSCSEGRKVVEGWLNDLDKFQEGYAAKGAPASENWGPDNPKPQTVDWDNGTCPYKRESYKPLGCKENPVVVGVPESSTHLVFSTDRKCWILTDGLGNGWIR